MPDYSGVYYLPVEPPESWRLQLDALASSVGVKVRLASKTGRTLKVLIRVPFDRTAPVNELADSFLEDVVSIVSRESSGSGRARLVAASLVANPANFQLSKAFGLASLLLVVVLPFFIHFDGNLGLIAKSVLFLITGATFSWLVQSLVAETSAKGRRNFAELEREKDVVRERVLAHEVAREEDPKSVARLELARIALRSRASLMRGDADRLWRRSIWAYRGAFIFFLLAIAGPSVAAALLLNSSNPDWHFMFGGLSLAAVPLGIGTALLRHDTKLREQYQQTAQDVASLERYELALDYARIASHETYQVTMQQVIAQLISSRSSGPLQVQMGAGVGGKEGEGEPGLGVQKLVDMTFGKASDIVEVIVPKKGV